MKSFVIYNKKDNTLECEGNLPVLCQKYFYDKNKKCAAYYKKITKNFENCECMCPYGLFTIKRENNIYTGLIIKEINYDKLQEIYKYHNEKININEIYSKFQLINYIDDIENIYSKTEKVRECIHELSNIGGYFNSMIYNIKENFPELCEDDDVKAMLCLYDMLNYRISLTSEISEVGYKKRVIKIHRLLHKLKIMMNYKARKREIRIVLDSNDSFVDGCNNLYLAMFILLDNAVKYSPSGGEIQIFFDSNQNEVSVSIQNIGPLVLDDELDKLTINGYRGHKANTSGNGIGLYIFDKITKKANYKYKIISKQINDEQSMFCVTIILNKKEESDYINDPSDL